MSFRSQPFQKLLYHPKIIMARSNGSKPVIQYVICWIPIPQKFPDKMFDAILTCLLGPIHFKSYFIILKLLWQGQRVQSLSYSTSSVGFLYHKNSLSNFRCNSDVSFRSQPFQKLLYHPKVIMVRSKGSKSATEYVICLLVSL